MRTIKSTLLIIIGLVMIIPFFQGCKKGEDDPLISLRSRKARVVGEWTYDNWIQDFNLSSTYTSSGTTFNTSGKEKTEINGSSLQYSYSGTSNYNSDISTTTGTGSGYAIMKITFNKDGTFSQLIQYTNFTTTYNSITTFGTSSFSISGSHKIEISGTWNFLGGLEEDYKNKERLILNILTSQSTLNYTDSDGAMENYSINETYANGENSEVWHIMALRNKKMVLIGEVKNTSSYNSISVYNGNSFSSISSFNQSGQVEGTLVQK